MEQETVPSIFDSMHDTTAVRRKDMIPKWMRVFAWIFAILSPLSMLMMLVVTLMYDRISSIPNMGNLTLYSAIGIATFISNIIQTITAIGLLREKNWAVRLAIVDSIIYLGLIIHGFFMPDVNASGPAIKIASALINLPLLTLFFIKMIKIRKDWEEDRYMNPQEEMAD